MELAGRPVCCGFSGSFPGFFPEMQISSPRALFSNCKVASEVITLVFGVMLHYKHFTPMTSFNGVTALGGTLLAPTCRWGN